MNRRSPPEPSEPPPERSSSGRSPSPDVNIWRELTDTLHRAWRDSSAPLLPIIPFLMALLSPNHSHPLSQNQTSISSENPENRNSPASESESEIQSDTNPLLSELSTSDTTDSDEQFQEELPDDLNQLFEETEHEGITDDEDQQSNHETSNRMDESGNLDHSSLSFDVRRTIYLFRYRAPSYTETPSASDSSSGPQGEREDQTSPTRRPIIRVILLVEVASTSSASPLDGNADFEEILNQLLQMHQPQGPPPAPKEVIDSIPLIEIDERRLQEHSTTCPVCLDEFVAASKAALLPCKHLFHQDCVSTWLSQHNSCPICRFALSSEPVTATTTHEDSSFL